MTERELVPVDADTAPAAAELVMVVVALEASSAGVTGGDWADEVGPFFGVDFDFPPEDWRFGKLLDYEGPELTNELRAFELRKQDIPPGHMLLPPQRDLGQEPDQSKIDALMAAVGMQLLPSMNLLRAIGGVRFDCPREEVDDPHDLISPRFIFVCSRADAEQIAPRFPYNVDKNEDPARKAERGYTPWLIDEQIGDVDQQLKQFRVYTSCNHPIASAIFKQFSNFNSKDANRCFCGSTTPDLLPGADEGMDDWMQRIALSTDEIDKILWCWDMSERQAESFLALYPGRKPPREEFLVPGFIPRPKLTVVAGEGGVGKSTLITELAAKVADTRRDSWDFLGTSIKSGGKVLVFTKDETQADWHLRLEYFGQQLPVWIYDDSDLSLDDCVRIAAGYDDVSLVIFDPLVKYVGEDEDSSTKTTAAMSQFQRIAVENHCAVVVLHHLKKGSSSNWNDMKNRIRGSSAIPDAARMTIGIMRRSGDIAEIAIVKTNIIPKYLTWAEPNKPRRFYRNKDTLTLDPEPAGLNGKAPSTLNMVADELEEAVMAAFTQINEQHEVRLTGKKSVYAARSPLLEGISRARVEETVQSLISQGRLAASGGIISLAS